MSGPAAGGPSARPKQLRRHCGRGAGVKTSLGRPAAVQSAVQLRRPHFAQTASAGCSSRHCPLHSFAPPACPDLMAESSVDGQQPEWRMDHPVHLLAPDREHATLVPVAESLRMLEQLQVCVRISHPLLGLLAGHVAHYCNRSWGSWSRAGAGGGGGAGGHPARRQIVAAEPAVPPKVFGIWVGALHGPQDGWAVDVDQAAPAQPRPENAAVGH